MYKDEYPLLADNQSWNIRKTMPPTRMPFCKLKIWVIYKDTNYGGQYFYTISGALSKFILGNILKLEVS